MSKSKVKKLYKQRQRIFDKIKEYEDQAEKISILIDDELPEIGDDPLGYRLFDCIFEGEKKTWKSATKMTKSTYLLAVELDDLAYLIGHDELPPKEAEIIGCRFLELPT